MNYSNSRRSLILIFILFILTSSCSRSEGEGYIREEDRVLLDMVPVMVEAEFMLAHNDLGTRPILYIVEDLNNVLEPTPYDSISDQDAAALAPLLKARMKKRKISRDVFIDYKELKVELLSFAEFEREHQKTMIETIDAGGVLGYLGISRVVLNRNLTKGYLSFNFFCGTGCAWNSTIEIVKVNGKWKEGRFLFGGIA